MRKRIAFLSFAAALVFCYSCSNDETVAVNTTPQDNEISFRALTNGITRALPKTSFVTNDVIDVYADFDGSKFFQADFTKQAGANFTSVSKYYWPNDIGNAKGTEPETYKTMTFTAFYGAAQSTSTAGSLSTAYTPDAAAANQTDLLFAKHSATAKEVPVVLNFRHMLSQINVLAKNTNTGISVDISGVRIGYVKTSGTFAYAADAADTQNSGKLAQNIWSATDFTAPGVGETYADNYKYDQAVTKTLNGNTAAGALTSYVPWMLIPQNMAGSSTQYQNAKSGGTGADAPDLGGSYIALQLTIYNWNGSARGSVIVSTQWCYWPITTAWNPGYNYTYTIDVAGGGFMPTDTNNDKNLDPVLNDPIEFSVNCTIDDWTDSGVDVP